MDKKEKLEALKRHATELGIVFRDNISAKTLQKRIYEKIPNPVKAAIKKQPVKPMTPGERFLDAHKLVRIRLTCMNPDKRNWPGEIFTIRNRVIGTIRKYVPFIENEEGYHVPNSIYKMLKNKQCQALYDVRMPKGQKVTRSKLIKEFSIERLPDLTLQELKDLAAKQAASHSID